MDSEMLDMLRTSLEHVLTEESTQPLSQRLDELGWSEVLDDDAPSALKALFDVKGRTLSAADALGPLLASTIANVLGSEAIGTATVLLPSTLAADDRTTIDAAGALTVDGIVFTVPAAGTAAIAPVAAYSGTALALVTVPGTATIDALSNTDANLGLSRVQFSVPSSNVTWFTGPEATQAWDAAVAIGRWTLAAELLGVARHVIEEVATYTGQRIQYGKPIGTFQALQHRLASAHSTVTGASHVVDEAAVTGSPWEALVAKALAGRAAEFACTQAQQCYGAIGFTWEHEFHRSLRRAYQLDHVLGDYRTLEVEIGRQLLAQKSVPKIGAF